LKFISFTKYNFLLKNKFNLKKMIKLEEYVGRLFNNPN